MLLPSLLLLFPLLILTNVRQSFSVHQITSEHDRNEFQPSKGVFRLSWRAFSFCAICEILHLLSHIAIVVVAAVQLFVYICACSLKITRRGLGAASEQHVEGSHPDFKPIWSRYEIRDKTHPSYGANLLKAVCTFNSLHAPIATFEDNGRLKQSDQAGIHEGPDSVT